MNDHPTAPPEPSLSEVQARHPGWDIYPVFGGYLAVPKGVTVFHTVFLSALEEKLEARP